MPTVVLSSQNYNGQQAQITLTPSGGGSPVNIGIQTLPYTYTATNISGTYSLFFVNVGITCSAELDAPPVPGWRKLDFSCETSETFQITHSLTGISSPVDFLYDANTNRVWVADADDNTRGNIYWFNPTTASTNASHVNYITNAAGFTPWLRAPGLINAVTDPIYKRLYFTGTDNVPGGEQLPTDTNITGMVIYDIETNTLSQISYGSDILFQRSFIYLTPTHIFGNVSTSTLIKINRVNPSLPTTNVTLQSNVNFMFQNLSPSIKEVGTGTTETKLWMVSNAGSANLANNGTNILITDLDFVFVGIITLPDPGGGPVGNTGTAWLYSYYDKEKNYFYVSDIFRKRYYVIRPSANNNSGTIVLNEDFKFRMEGKIQTVIYWQEDPTTNKLYMIVQLNNDVNQDFSGPFKTYELDRDNFRIKRMIYNYALLNIKRIPNEYGTNSLGTCLPRNIAWAPNVQLNNPSLMNDGSLTFFNNNVGGTDRTGLVRVDTLEEYNTLNNQPLGNTKPNLPDDPDYIEPFVDTHPTTGCPITYTLNCPVIVRSLLHRNTNTITDVGYEVNVENSVKNNPSITQIGITVRNGSTVIDQDIYNSPFEYNYFYGVFSGLTYNTQYQIRVSYSGSTGTLVTCN